MKDEANTLENDSELLALIAAEPERGLAEVYKTYKREFMFFAKQYGGDADVHLDCYHDAVLAFYNILLEDKYDEERASIKTLLFAIGKYKVISRVKKDSREPLWEELENYSAILEKEHSDNDARLEVAKKAVSLLGEKCQQIIELFYFKRKSIREIQRQLGYKNENVVKAHKSRCMKTLRENVEQLTRERGRR